MLKQNGSYSLTDGACIDDRKLIEMRSCRTSGEQTENKWRTNGEQVENSDLDIDIDIDLGLGLDKDLDKDLDIDVPISKDIVCSTDVQRVVEEWNRLNDIE